MEHGTLRILSQPSTEVEDGELRQDCPDLCSYMYDAVWAGALAIATSLGSGGSVNKAGLVHLIRGRSFQASSGTVALDPTTGDRSANGVSITVKNWQLGDDGRVSILTIGVWDSVSGLVKSEGVVPYWGSGGVGWDNLLQDPSLCPAGTIYTEDTGDCQPCSPGTFQTGFICETCPIGKIAAQAGESACAPCEDGYANETGMTHCLSCPENAVRQASSAGVSPDECLCKEGYYLDYRSESGCSKCPTGAVCLGGQDAPHPIQTYWADRRCKQFNLGGDLDCDRNRWDSFFECFNEEDCKGSKEFSCGYGRTGRLCMQPDDGFYSIGGFWFDRCGEYGYLKTIAGISGVVLVWFLLNNIASGNYDAADIALLFVQVTGMIATYGLKWHPNLKEMNMILSIANFDTDFITPNCLGTWTPIYAFFLQLLFPLIFGGCYVIYYGVWLYFHKIETEERKEALHKQIAATFVAKTVSFSIIVYHTLCIKCFQVLSCKTFPDGKQYMRFAPEVECYEGAHWLMVGTVVVYVPVVIIGLPCFIAWVVIKHRRDGTLHNADVDVRWGALHVRYESDWKFWETVLLMRRLVIAFLSVAVEISMLQAALTMCVLAMFLAAHVYAKPYISSLIDQLDFFSIMGCMMYVLAGMLFYPSITAESQRFICAGDEAELSACKSDTSIKFVVSVVILAWTILTLGISGGMSYIFVKDVRHSKKASQLIHSLLDNDQMIERSSSSQDRVTTTANKVGLEDAMKGTPLLKWATELERTHSMSGSILKASLIASAQSFADVNRRMQKLSEDVTHYSKSEYARILRSVVEDIPEMLDWVSYGASEADRESLRRVTRSLARFSSRSKGQDLPCYGVINEEHRSVMLCTLLECTDEEKMQFCQLLDAVMGTSHMDPTVSIQDRARISSSERSLPPDVEYGANDSFSFTGSGENDSFSGRPLIADFNISNLSSPNSQAGRAFREHRHGGSTPMTKGTGSAGSANYPEIRQNGKPHQGPRSISPQAQIRVDPACDGIVSSELEAVAFGQADSGGTDQIYMRKVPISTSIEPVTRKLHGGRNDLSLVNLSELVPLARARDIAEPSETEAKN